MPFSILLQKSSGVVFWLLSGLLAYQVAQLTWSLFPTQEPQYQWVAPKKKTTSSEINTQKLQQQHLFGEAVRNKGQEKPLSVAPKTKLNVTLVGVVAASDPDYSSAIISYKGKQESYFIDSKINGTSATVSKIYEDRVLLDVDGVLQTLMLDGVDDFQRKTNVNQRVTRAKESTEAVEIELDREELLQDPGKLTDYIRISPYRQDGEVLGYRLKPGKEPELFEQAGFQKDDLAVELNGVDLTDTQQAFTLMKEFSTMTEISVTVERDGQLYDLSLNIP